MRKQYTKPITEIISVNSQYVMTSNSEPEVTYNIGAKENTFEWNNEGLWEDEDDENEDD